MGIFRLLAKTIGTGTVAGLGYLAVQPGGIASSVHVPDDSLLEVVRGSSSYIDAHQVVVPVSQVLQGRKAARDVTDDEVTKALARGLFASPVLRAELYLTKGQRDGRAWVVTQGRSSTVCDFDSGKWRRALARTSFKRGDDVSGFTVANTCPGEVIMRNGAGGVETSTWVSACVERPGGDDSQAVVKFRLGSAVGKAPGAAEGGAMSTMVTALIPFHYVYSKFVLGFAVKEAIADLSGQDGGALL